MSGVEGETPRTDNIDHIEQLEHVPNGKADIRRLEQTQTPFEDADHDIPSSHGVTITVEDADAEDARLEQDSGDAASQDDASVVTESQQDSEQGSGSQE